MKTTIVIGSQTNHQRDILFLAHTGHVLGVLKHLKQRITWFEAGPQEIAQDRLELIKLLYPDANAWNADCQQHGKYY